jgi:holo-[acyl-carrier protein] synthase
MAAETRVRVGVDVVDVGRIARLVADPAAAARLFTQRELAYCGGKRLAEQHLAARFAAKEAVLKAFGTGLGARMRWTDVEIVSGPGGRPVVELHGAVAAWARSRRLQAVDVSLSHDGGIAIAHAVTAWRAAERSARVRLTARLRRAVAAAAPS